MAQLIPLPLTISCSSKSFGFIFLVLAHPGSPRLSRGRKMVVVVVTEQLYAK